MSFFSRLFSRPKSPEVIALEARVRDLERQLQTAQREARFHEEEAAHYKGMVQRAIAAREEDRARALRRIRRRQLTTLG